MVQKPDAAWFGYCLMLSCLLHLLEELTTKKAGKMFAGTINISTRINPDPYKSNYFSGLYPSILRMISVGGINFYRYFRNMGISTGSDLIVLSPKDHFHCEEGKLRSVRTLINPERLNLVKYLDVFLTSLAVTLAPDTKFIGCFLNRKRDEKNNTVICRFFKTIMKTIGIQSIKHDRGINGDEIISLLEKNNFRIVDMKEMNGRMYFISQVGSQRA
jgi:hypothetical protein